MWSWRLFLLERLSSIPLGSVLLHKPVYGINFNHSHWNLPRSQVIVMCTWLSTCPTLALNTSTGGGESLAMARLSMEEAIGDLAK